MLLHCMGNYKNKRHNGNGCRKVFGRNRKRRKFAQKHQPEPQQVRVSVPDSQVQTGPSIGGSRIINLELLQKYTNDLTIHSARCGGNISLTGETRHGLASILKGQCSSCGHTITFATSPKVKGPRQFCRWECNLAAVWGQMATGGGHSHLEESMSTIGIPVMTQSSFISTERDIGKWWKDKLAESMIEAGKEEKRLAEERGSYHDGVPAICVVVDGGWSKRSHKHSYNAN